MVPFSEKFHRKWSRVYKCSIENGPFFRKIENGPIFLKIPQKMVLYEKKVHKNGPILKQSIENGPTFVKKSIENGPFLLNKSIENGPFLKNIPQKMVPFLYAAGSSPSKIQVNPPPRVVSSHRSILLSVILNIFMPLTVGNF